MPSPTPDTFDASLLSTLVLQPSDVAPLTMLSSGLAAGTENPSYSARYGGTGSLVVQATVQRIADPVVLDQTIFDLRSTFKDQITNERTRTFDGANEAFSYASHNIGAPKSAVLMSVGDFVVFFVVGATTDVEKASVHDKATLDRYAAATISRIAVATGIESSPTPGRATPIKPQAGASGEP